MDRFSLLNTSLPFFAGIVVLSLLFSGCGLQEEDPEELILSLPSDPISLDPLFSTDLSSRTLGKFLYPFLFQKTPDGNPAYQLVESHRLTGKGEVRSLKLKLKSHRLTNGEELNASQVKESLDRLRNTPGPRRNQYTFLKEITAIGEKEIELKITVGLRQAVDALSLPPAAIVCCKPSEAHSLEAESLETLEKKNVSDSAKAGRYILKEWKKNNYILLEKNPSVTEDLPKKIRLRILASASTGVFLFSKGRMDLMRLPNFLLKNPHIRKENLRFRKGSGVQYIAINANESCFDVNFRKALNTAVNRDLVIEKLLEGNADPTFGPVPLVSVSQTKMQEIAGTNPDFSAIQSHSPEKAKEYLKKSSCYPNILEREIDFRMRGDDENNANGLALAGFLKELGLKVKIRPMEKAVLYKENGEGKGDLTLLFWYADLPGAWNFIDPLFSGKDKGNGGNRAHYENKELELLFTKARSSDSLNLETETTKALQILLREYPWIFLWSPYETFLISEKAKRYPSLAEYL
ncbi:ABC transporter substrate-binding protein [Leptospira yasudae]|uniref:ABC transporter substrate-binding protein n=1 Tax=Leptospira yasudae TaxID=2202201 RepID=A0A6N4QCT6_9LEPT|nr:ABC transporter substrate-binding protein [Leptospira yasudae]TGL74446.1 ABC transporter substrate-binding protein [Leptospira yasudae]TGL80574.1 ABC transporter substrate-binding protein [Leptospira yasudae]TGL84316.1 ABC transporter substrate-binding protein [Leptospira yasudae]